MATDRTIRPVPILDQGVTLDRGDGTLIVLLDGLGPDDVQREIDAICAMLAGGERERREEER